MSSDLAGPREHISCVFRIVIPLYNKEKYILRTIETVLNQTFADFEVVVVDDGSMDSGPDIVASVTDRRIRLVRQENSGAAAARNKGIEEARFDYIAFLDADDEWYPEFLETIHHLIERYPGAGAYGTRYCITDLKGNLYNINTSDELKEPFEGII